MSLQQVILGLGSNCEPRSTFLREAVARVESHPVLNLQSLLSSHIYESPALLPPNAPKEWDTPYLNMVICGFTAASPREILAAVKGIERELGRQARGWWAPREIDIDLLALGNQQLNETDLIVPHKEMLRRDFVMVPLADVLPKWTHPTDATRRSAADYAKELRPSSALVTYDHTIAA